MYVKEVCLEGFKSYATRTVISGFDPFFNAITGLNGSGKSNILDSICFVLGITNLRQVRASSLQELVYKQGQAGVTKATVSIIFDNSDRSRSPLGYEDCKEITVTRQIVVGGRNKYLINGHLAQPSRVESLFHSVQLNVNNPHFLIMQGRITKVLNMKPPEILSMLEEAAGTRMYENKKEQALKTLDKKQSKVDEIDNLLDKEILPALEKLRKERVQYMQWANGNAELDRLRRFCIAYDFVQAEKIRDYAINGVAQMKSKMVELEESNAMLEKEIQEIEANISNLTLEKETTMGGEMKKVSENVDALSCSLVRETSIFKNKEETLQAERKAAKQLAKSIEDIKSSIHEKEEVVKKAEEGGLGLKKKVEDLSVTLENYEKEYQAVLTGKGSGVEEKCLEDQLRDAKSAAGVTETELKQLKTRLNHMEKELKEKKALLMSKQEEAVAVEKELNVRRKEVEDLKASISSTAYENGRLEALQEDKLAEREKVQKLKDDIRKLSAELASVQFTYRDPVKNFDRLKVKGVVAKLIRVKDSSTMTALEVAAKGKLYNIVVDNENTGKLLLEKGQLQKRITIIPLNRIQSYVVPQKVQETAKRLVGHENAEVALYLVSYDDDVKNAMAYVFGSTFICKTADAAKEIAFNKSIKCPSVTLEGDDYSARGYLTGGSRRDGGRILRQLHQLAECEEKLSVHLRKLSEIETEISCLLPLHKKFSQLKSQLELKEYDLSLFKKRSEQNEYSRLSELVRKIETEVQEVQLRAKEKQLSLQKYESEISSLEKTIKDYSKTRESRLKDLDKKIKAAKTKLQSASKDLKEQENTHERVKMEKDAMHQELLSLEQQLVSMEAQINDLAKDVDEQATKLGLIKKNFENAQSELNQIRAQIKERDSQINSLSKKQRSLQQKISDSNVSKKKLENEMKRMELEQKECSVVVEKLLEKHTWIMAEKALFGKNRTDYDFTSRDPLQTREQLENLQVEQTNLEKRVNKKVMAMFEKAEDEYNELISKKNIIENDKSKIKRVIEELDEKKRETLSVTWVKVNRDFGSIFSTLLPGTTAKLEPPEGCTFLDGLEVRVAFGSVWKQSLSELSGGQRSLLALSLVLALLLFKPAPLYILDEVDAALDLSHTQNIGRMIKTHFPHSQFIVVSLKEGMFNNANVIFRTKFVDGVSTVQRTVTKQK